MKELGKLIGFAVLAASTQVVSIWASYKAEEETKRIKVRKPKRK